MSLLDDLLGTPPFELSLEDLEASLDYLLHWYRHRRSPMLSVAVTRHIEVLLAHPDLDEHPGQHCMYRRLAREWGYIASSDSCFGANDKFGEQRSLRGVL
jgi:hypothetical protein